MKVPTLESDGLYLKFFVLKMEDPDAVRAAILYAMLKGNDTLLADLLKHLKELEAIL